MECQCLKLGAAYALLGAMLAIGITFSRWEDLQWLGLLVTEVLADLVVYDGVGEASHPADRCSVL